MPPGISPWRCTPSHHQRWGQKTAAESKSHSTIIVASRCHGFLVSSPGPFGLRYQCGCDRNHTGSFLAHFPFGVLSPSTYQRSVLQPFPSALLLCCRVRCLVHALSQTTVGLGAGQHSKVLLPRSEVDAFIQITHTYIHTYIHTWLKATSAQGGSPSSPPSAAPSGEHILEKHTKHGPGRR